MSKGSAAATAPKRATKPVSVSKDQRPKVDRNTGAFADEDQPERSFSPADLDEQIEREAAKSAKRALQAIADAQVAVTPFPKDAKPIVSLRFVSGYKETIAWRPAAYGFRPKDQTRIALGTDGLVYFEKTKQIGNNLVRGMWAVPVTCISMIEFPLETIAPPAREGLS